MARDLHDVITRQLSAIAIQSEAALTLPDPDSATLHRVLTSARRNSVASLTEMRRRPGRGGAARLPASTGRGGPMGSACAPAYRPR